MIIKLALFLFLFHSYINIYETKWWVFTNFRIYVDRYDWPAEAYISVVIIFVDCFGIIFSWFLNYLSICFCFVCTCNYNLWPCLLPVKRNFSSLSGRGPGYFCCYICCYIFDLFIQIKMNYIYMLNIYICNTPDCSINVITDIMFYWYICKYCSVFISGPSRTATFI